MSSGRAVNKPCGKGIIRCKLTCEKYVLKCWLRPVHISNGQKTIKVWEIWWSVHYSSDKAEKWCNSWQMMDCLKRNASLQSFEAKSCLHYAGLEPHSQDHLEEACKTPLCYTCSQLGSSFQNLRVLCCYFSSRDKICFYIENREQGRVWTLLGRDWVGLQILEKFRHLATLLTYLQ